MAVRSLRVLVIDDDPAMTADAERELLFAFKDDPEISVEIQVENNFNHGYELVRDGRCDIAILDVRRDRTESVDEDRETGRVVYDDIRKVRFLPIIFWTALPLEVEDKLMPPMVTVFQKDDLALVPGAIRAAIAGGAVDIMRSIEDNVASVMRDHMWNELVPNWNEDTDGGQPRELAHILISRVANGLQDQAFPELTAKPSHRYLYPPASKRHRPGDLLRAKGGKWWVILTPACDLAHEGKADFVLIGRASPLKAFSKYETWAASPSRGTLAPLRDVLVGKIARYCFVPEFRDIPDLVLDLEDVHSIPIGGLAEFERVASLVAPYSEALLAKFSHFRGRIGTPDLNFGILEDRLKAELTVEK